MSRPAGIYNFEVSRGADFSRTFRIKDQDTDVPIDLTGKFARVQFRTYAGRYGSTTTTTLLLEMENGDGIEVLSGSGGLVKLDLTVNQTITLCPTNEKTKISYEIELYTVSPAAVEKFLRGNISLKPETAR